MDYIRQYVDYDKLFDKALYKKIKLFYESLNWEEPTDKEYSLEMFFFNNTFYIISIIYIFLI